MLRTLSGILIGIASLCAFNANGPHNWIPFKTSFWDSGDLFDHLCILFCILGFLCLAISNIRAIRAIDKKIAADAK